MAAVRRTVVDLPLVPVTRAMRNIAQACAVEVEIRQLRQVLFGPRLRTRSQGLRRPCSSPSRKATPLSAAASRARASRLRVPFSLAICLAQAFYHRASISRSPSGRPSSRLGGCCPCRLRAGLWRHRDASRGAAHRRGWRPHRRDAPRMTCILGQPTASSKAALSAAAKHPPPGARRFLVRQFGVSARGTGPWRVSRLGAGQAPHDPSSLHRSRSPSVLPSL